MQFVPQDSRQKIKEAGRRGTPTFSGWKSRALLASVSFCGKTLSLKVRCRRLWFRCRVREFRGPAGHVVEEVGGEVDVGHLGDGEGFAVVEGFEFREFVEVGEDEVTYFPDDLAALGGSQFAPWTVEGLAGGFDGEVNVRGLLPATLAMVSPVAGSKTLKVLPVAALTHLPSMRSCLGLERKLRAATSTFVRGDSRTSVDIISEGWRLRLRDLHGCHGETHQGEAENRMKNLPRSAPDRCPRLKNPRVCRRRARSPGRVFRR